MGVFSMHVHVYIRVYHGGLWCVGGRRKLHLYVILPHSSGALGEEFKICLSVCPQIPSANNSSPVETHQMGVC